MMPVAAVLSRAYCGGCEPTPAARLPRSGTRCLPAGSCPWGKCGPRGTSYWDDEPRGTLRGTKLGFGQERWVPTGIRCRNAPNLSPWQFIDLGFLSTMSPRDSQ